MVKLSILICSVFNRYDYLHRLLQIISLQDPACLVYTEVLISSDNSIKPIGQKRNELLADSRGKYVVFVNDDDTLSKDYLQKIFAGIEKDVDHVGICMMYQPDKGIHKLVHCSKDNTWGERDGIYLRGVQHVCPIRREIAIQGVYPATSFGEDMVYSQQVTPLVKTEHLIDEAIYFYKYRSNKNTPCPTSAD